MGILSPEYVAGFFDGEGSITYQEAPYRRHGQLRGKSFHLRVTLGNTNFQILKDLEETFGGSVSGKWHTNPNAKACWTWFAADRKAENFLSIVGPLLRIKQPQYQVALEFFAWKRTPREERYDKLPPGEGTFVRSMKTLEKEAEFKSRLNDLNRRGVLPS